NVVGAEALFNQYNNDMTAIMLDDRLYSQKVGDVISTSFMAVMDVNRSYSPYFAEDAVHAGINSSAMVITDNEDPHEYAVFNRNHLTAFQMDDIITNPAGVIDDLQQEKQGIWAKTESHHLLIPTDDE